MAIWLTKDSKVIVQGMTGSEGSKHTRRMLRAGTNIVGGVTPGKGGQRSTSTVTPLPVFNSVAEAMAATGADVDGHLRAAEVRQGRGGRGDRRRHPARRRHHRGHPGARHRGVLGAQRRHGGARPASSGPNCPGIASPGQSNAGIIPADISRRRAGSAWSPSRAR